MKPLLNEEIRLHQAWQFLTNDKSWQSHYKPSISLVWAQFKFLNMLFVGCTLFLKITQLACIKAQWLDEQFDQPSNAQNETTVYTKFYTKGSC